MLALQVIPVKTAVVLMATLVGIAVASNVAMRVAGKLGFGSVNPANVHALQRAALVMEYLEANYGGHTFEHIQETFGWTERQTSDVLKVLVKKRLVTEDLDSVQEAYVYSHANPRPERKLRSVLE